MNKQKLKALFSILIYVVFLICGRECLKVSEPSVGSNLVSQNLFLRANTLFYYEYLGEYEVSAYSSEESQTDDTPFLTASQTQVRDGVIACPRDVEFGERRLIDDKAYSCEDVMNKRYKRNLDIWFATRSEALEYGRQIKKVYAIR